MNKKKKEQVVLLVLLVVLVVGTLALNQNAAFEGADGEAEEVIAVVNPDYEPWFEPVWEPPSGEIESLLFALQAALGTGFICFYFGYKAGERKKSS